MWTWWHSWGLRRAYGRAVRRGDDVEAQQLAHRITQHDPAAGAFWFDLGLAAKRRRDWAESLRLNLRARDAHDGGPGDPAAWNLGIAATALGDWERARQAWSAFGIDVPPGDGPLVMPTCLAPVRLNPSGTRLREDPLTIDGVRFEPEVVWTEQLSPAHARIVNVPAASSGHRWGDVLLIDGVPHGERFDGHTWVPVVDELAILERSPHATWSAQVGAQTSTDVEELVELAEAAGRAAEDWTTGVRLLCAACSAGRPDDHDHDHETAGPHRDRALEHVGSTPPVLRTMGLAGDEDALTDVLVTWAAAGQGRSWSELVRVDRRTAPEGRAAT